MKATKWLLCGVALFVLAAPAPAEGEKPDKPAVRKSKREKAAKSKGDKERSKNVLRGYWAMLAVELKLDENPELKAKIEAKVKEGQEKLAAWEKANAAKLKEAREAMVEARKNKDRQAMQKARELMRPLIAERRKIEEENKAAVMALLSPAQRAQWKLAETYYQVVGRYARAGLTAEQKKQVRELCAKSAKALEGADKRARSALMRKLHAEIEQKILTEEQREKLKAPKKPKRDKNARKHKGSKSPPSDESEKPSRAKKS